MDKISLNLTTKLKFAKHNGIPAGIAIDTIKIINDSYFRSELNDLFELKKEFPEIPQIVIDATETRIRRERNSAILVKGVEKGSVEIVVVGTGLLIWVLQQTLGETMKEAWLDSKLHEKIKNFLLGRRSKKNRKIKEDTKKRLRYKLHAEVNVGYSESNENAEIHCEIWFNSHGERLFPETPDELIK